MRKEIAKRCSVIAAEKVDRYRRARLRSCLSVHWNCGHYVETVKFCVNVQPGSEFFVTVTLTTVPGATG